MPRWVWPLALLVVLCGAAAGYVSVPHYRPPQAADDARLRERALAYYQASRRFEMRQMVQLFTPARQYGDADALRELVDQRSSDLSRVKPATRAGFEAAAQAITPDHLVLRVEGDWAISSGTAPLPASGDSSATTTPLESIVWLRSEGDWWIYVMHRSELIAYGAPPDFARPYVADQQREQETQRLLDDAQGGGAASASGN